MRYCNGCKATLPLEAFNKNKAKKDGLQTQCRACNNLHSRAYYEKNREYHKKAVLARNKAYAAELKRIVREAKDVPCADCGIKYPPYVMDFDHVTGVKLGNISNMVGECVRIEKLTEEIAKCEVVCSNCHRERSYSRREDWVVWDYE